MRIRNKYEKRYTAVLYVLKTYIRLEDVGNWAYASVMDLSTGEIVYAGTRSQCRQLARHWNRQIARRIVAPPDPVGVCMESQILQVIAGELDRGVPTDENHRLREQVGALLAQYGEQERGHSVNLEGLIEYLAAGLSQHPD